MKTLIYALYQKKLPNTLALKVTAFHGKKRNRNMKIIYIIQACDFWRTRSFITINILNTVFPCKIDK